MIEVRRTKSTRILEDFSSGSPTVTKPNLQRVQLGRAMAYATNYKGELGHFLDDQALPLDNNAAERVLRMVAVGRKNFLLAGRVDDGQNLAVPQSSSGTCGMHEVNPLEYISDVRTKNQKPRISLDELLPRNRVNFTTLAQTIFKACERPWVRTTP